MKAILTKLRCLILGHSYRTMENEPNPLFHDCECCKRCWKIKDWSKYKKPGELLIDKIYIRSQNKKGEWGSYSLHELYKQGLAVNAFAWLIETACGYKEADIISIDNLETLAKLLPKDSYVRLK